MQPALTVKSQVTIPKAIRQFLGIGPGDRVLFEPLPGNRVALRAYNIQPKTHKKPVDPITAMIGAATRKVRTEDVMRMTRGDDWNKA
jgi:AbrB family looped-hinge helix DNA binding protein